MASLYLRKGSPFWWIKYRQGNKIVRESTSFRRAYPGETRKARVLKNQKDLAELHSAPQVRHDWLWVVDYMRARYVKPKTFRDYLIRWKNLQGFLDSRDICGPSNLTHTHCLEYIAWRANPDAGFFKACKNTAIYELKLLSVLMAEAMRRGLATGNPCRGLGVKMDKPKDKPELTPEQVEDIRQKLSATDENGKRRWPEWMAIAFEIGMAQGCRERETCLPLSDINLDRMTITFRQTKGDRPYTTALNPAIAPLIRRLKSEGKTHTYEMPNGISAWWWRFFEREGFHKIKPPDGMSHPCFHSTRVSVATQLARQNVNEPLAMRYIGHASTTVHRVYQKLKVEDLGVCVQALQASPKRESQDSPASTPKPPAE